MNKSKMDREDSIIDFGESSSRTTQWVMESSDVEPDFETEVTEEYVIADEMLVEEKTVRTAEPVERTAIKIPKQLVSASSSFVKPRPIQKSVTALMQASGGALDPKKIGPVKTISLAEAQRMGLVPSNGSRTPHVVVVKPGTPGPGFKVVTGQAEIRVMTGNPSAKPVHLVKLDPANKGSAEFLSPKKVSVTAGKLPVRKSDDYSMPPPSPSPSVRGYGGSRTKGEVVMLSNPSYSRYAASAYAPSESGRESRMSGFSDIYSRADTLSPTPSTYGRNYESNGLKPRKPCNCNKSQCLKLYCECFANGEFCHNCNCLNCFNNLQHEEERQKAIKSCLDRNANAFKPKIGKVKGTNNSTERLHNKGCNCKRSGCLKNYCECFEAKIACSDKCKCLGCKNTEEALCPNSAAKEEKLSRVVKSVKTKTGEPKPPKSFGFMTQDVVEATCQCLLAQAEEAVVAGKSLDETERLILEEYGRCLVQIIDYANKVKS